jgi:large subunit ribosomal protein L10
MTREAKHKLVDEMAEEFSNSNAIVVCDYKGMTVKELESLRNVAREKELKVKVIKNRLALLSLKKAGKDGLTLKDTNLLVWGDDIVSLAKTVSEFSENNKDKFKVKSGYFESEVVDESTIEAYSKLASREEFLGMLLSTWTAPVRGLLTVFSGKQRELVTVLDAIKNKKEAA